MRVVDDQDLAASPFRLPPGPPVHSVAAQAARQDSQHSIMPFPGDGKKRKKFGDCRRDEEGDIQWDEEDYREFAEQDEEDAADDLHEYDINFEAMRKFEEACRAPAI